MGSEGSKPGGTLVDPLDPRMWDLGMSSPTSASVGGWVPQGARSLNKCKAATHWETPRDPISWDPMRGPNLRLFHLPEPPVKDKKVVVQNRQRMVQELQRGGFLRPIQ